MGAKVGMCVKGGDGGVCLAKCRDSSHGCQGRCVCEGVVCVCVCLAKCRDSSHGCQGRAYTQCKVDLSRAYNNIITPDTGSRGYHIVILLLLIQGAMAII